MPRPSPSKPSGTVGSGDIIVANHTSFVDVLWLNLRYVPQFAFPERAPGTGMRVTSLLGALKASFAQPPAAGSGSSNPLTAVSGVLAGPLVVFAEGTRAVSAPCLLTFAPALDVLAQAAAARKTKPTLHVVVFKRRPCDCYTVGSGFMFVLRHCMAVYNSCTVSMLPSGFTPQPQDPPVHGDSSKPADASDAGSSGSGQPAPYSATLRDAMLRLLPTARGLALTSADFAVFSDFYYNYGRKKQE